MSAPIGGQLSPGNLFHGHYEVVRCLSTGAMGAIYEVIDVKTQRRRALKLMLPSLVADQDMRARFKLEATVTAHIESEHIVETFDADVDPETGAPFLVMELLRGNDLADILAQRTRLVPSEVVQILAQASRALDKTHAAGIVHRDLKPENLFITRRDDGSIRVKILDFGIAKVVAASEGTQKKQQTINLGTPPYMSPEQILGDATIDHRADLYAIAHIAYALLVGEPYWLEESRKGDTLYRLLLRMVDGVKEQPTVRALRYGVTLPPGFDAWFFRATAKNPKDRFEHASELVIALAEAVEVPLNSGAGRLSNPDGDWDLDFLTRTGVNRIASVNPDAPLATPPPPVVNITGAPGGFATPNANIVVQVPSLPSLPGMAPAHPTPIAAEVDESSPPPQKRDRRAIWALMVLALIGGFVGVLIVAGSKRDPGATKLPATGNSTPSATVQVPPVTAAVDAGAPDAPAETVAPVVAISASSAPTAPTILPPGPAIGKTLPSSKQKAPVPEPTTTTTTTTTPTTTKHSSSGAYDPLRQL